MTTLNKSQILDEAKLLREAELNRKQVKATSLRHPELDLDDAYAIQQQGLILRTEAGERPIGRKIGLTSRAMQLQMKIDEPDYGVLTDAMLFADGDELCAADYMDPRIEIELAFILKNSLGGRGVNIDWLDVMAATEYVAPAFELIDARSHRVDPETGYTRNVFDTISDNAANAGVATGGRAVRPEAIDLRQVSGICSRNGVVEETGVAAGVLNHPANGVAWLANKLARHGQRLEGGETILSGSFIRPVLARPGDTFHADFGHLGQISCRFV